MISFIHHALLPLHLLEHFPELCGNLKQMCIPYPYWWRTSNIFVLCNAQSRRFCYCFLFHVVFLRIAMAFSYSTNSMKRLGIPLFIPNSLHRPLFILIQLIYLLKIQHIFKHDYYTGMTLTIASILLYRTSHTCKVFSFVLQIFSQIQHSKCFLTMT